MQVLDIQPIGDAPDFPEGHHIYRVTTSVPLHLNDTLTDAAVTLERAAKITTRGMGWTQRGRANIPSLPPEAMWLVDSSPSQSPPTADQLSEAIGQEVHLRTKRSGEYPGLLYVHRNVPMGQIAVSVVQDIPAIDDARIVSTDTAADTDLGLYAPDSLMAVLVRPNGNMKFSVRAVKRVLRL